MEKFSQNSAPMIGAWELISFKVQKANGEVIYPFGKNAGGQLYTLILDAFQHKLCVQTGPSSLLEIR